MKGLIQAVEQLRNLSNAHVDIDVNFRQDKELFRAQLHRRLRDIYPNHLVTDDDIEQSVFYTREGIEELKAKISPYNLPEDYIFFIEYYGGIAVTNETLRFEIYGHGPMVNELYGDWVCDNWGEREDPLLPGPRGLIIGYLRLDTLLPENTKRNKEQKEAGLYENPFEAPWHPKVESEWVELRFDLAGKVRPNCIIGLGPTTSTIEHPLSLENKDLRNWKVIANSLTELIEIASRTGCYLDYKSTSK